jgi:HNH endonuclease
MSFADAIRVEVRRRAAFQCCRCRIIGGGEAHHIIPESEGGPNTFDNAAPLCPTCHAEFGGNPDKRKEIRQMRDWWYETVEKKYGPAPDLHILEEIKSGVEDVQKNQLTLDNFKQVLRDNVLLAIDNLTMGTLASGATGIAEATAASFSPSPSPSPSPPYIEDESLPIPASGHGGEGGTISLITERLSGSGKILAEGGRGSIGGKGGKIHIQSRINKFSGTISSSGGKAIESSTIKDK